MLGLYVHIPFCVRKCAYCDFLSFGGQSEQTMREYCSLLCRELSTLPLQGEALSTVFFGGGTPSILPEGEITRLLDAIRMRWVLASDAEVSMEGNPGALSPATLREAKAAGVNRLSLGVQSFDDGLLKALGRIHRAVQAEETFFAAREAGFENINLDLMYGLPGQTVSQHLDTVKKALALSPEHVSMYSLIVEEGTEFGRRSDAGTLLLPEEEAEYAMEQQGRALLQAAGYERYEISNYAKPGFRCRHNATYWQCGDYLSAGLGAASALWEGDKCVLRTGLRELSDYRAALQAGTYAPEAEVQQGADAAFLALMMGLRMTDGIDEAAFSRRFGKAPEAFFPRSIAAGKERGLLLEKDGRLFCSARGLEVQNDLLSDILEECEAR